MSKLEKVKQEKTFQEVTQEELTANLGPDGKVQQCMLIHHMNGCGPCGLTMPLYKEASIGASVPFFSIERLEALKTTTNGSSLLQDFEIRGFPTILFWDRQSPRCVAFQGDRTIERIREFAQKHTRA